jgi:putative membrane protein
MSIQRGAPMRRFIQWLIGLAVVQTVILLFLAWLLPGFGLGELQRSVPSALIISALLALAWPIIYILAARFHPMLFPILTFALAGFVVYLIGKVDIEGFRVDSVWTGIAVVLGLSIADVLVGAIFSIDDSMAYEWFVVRPLRRKSASSERSSTPGILFLEIDGLAEPILREAIEHGHMPTLGRWIEDGSHKLIGWEPDLSSQTSASQAGILLGDNTGIPAFRWYDKQAGKLMVSSNMQTAKELERRLSSAGGLLAEGGASRWNVFSGDATDCLCTFSTFNDPQRSVSRGYAAYFSNPFTFSRTLGLLVSDVVRERYQAWRQDRQDVRPRIHRHFKYAFVRAGTTTLMQEASLFMLITDMFRGVPAVYNTFFAYDEVAHHSGIDRPDAFKVLHTLDEVFAKLERASTSAPRPYHFVILSDHGQSMGATFKQRYGQSLSEFVRTLISDEQQVASAESTVEDWGNLNLALSEAIHQDSRTTRLIQKAVRGKMEDGAVALSPEGEPSKREKEHQVESANVVVLASGNLGLISFPDWKTRMTYEQIAGAYKGLLNGLASHEGIGFVMVHSETDGGVVIGAKGIHYLNDGHVVGEDPLSSFGQNAARHLKRENSFVNAPDILVMSLYDAQTGDVAAFEELVGCHGGLGGTQTQPFVLFPTDFSTPSEPIVGAAALHGVLKKWRHNLTELPGDVAPHAIAAKS